MFVYQARQVSGSNKQSLAQEENKSWIRLGRNPNLLVENIKSLKVQVPRRFDFQILLTLDYYLN